VGISPEENNMDELLQTLDTWPASTINPKDVTALLGFDRKTIYEIMKRKNHPPYHRIAGRIKMCPRKLAEWFRKNQF
jgi:hypothetical protein